jgi:hypothetical protein
VPSSDHSMSHGGGPSFMAGSYGQDYHQNDSIHHNGNRSPMDDSKHDNNGGRISHEAEKITHPSLRHDSHPHLT